MKILLVVLGFLLAATGAVTWWGFQQPAEADAETNAEALFRWAGDQVTPLWLAKVESAKEDGVVLLVDSGSGEGREIVVRSTGHSKYKNNFDFDIMATYRDTDYPVTRCYAWDGSFASADEVSCPTEKKIDPRPQSAGSPLPADAHEILRRTLSGLAPTERADPGAVRRALGDRAGLQVERVDSTVAVAWLGEHGFGDTECAFALVEADRIWVWSPSSIQVAPGEGTCDPASAASAYMQSPPH